MVSVMLHIGIIAYMLFMAYKAFKLLVTTIITEPWIDILKTRDKE